MIIRETYKRRFDFGKRSLGKNRKILMWVLIRETSHPR